ncbi:mitochondrial ATP-independent inner membrane protease subunit 1a-like [Salvia miltiorrhiza]|uniref:mitochondrial ATP-independent inner membrane protease subunit 1a-like n=1 Tax=Salvia miltiorrhiza TaxID=226208 RepID=UPI0025ACE87B|nr:mitochondrial ATP-independent inner membrane protease subunit 1a-like [Salvia miltiorrhiza]XP_057764253.1 mitochondrial ATP-independent inner membrane protease subunit 1a-like [Salvia miltiorrhiza]XP_057764254.1 mitochondrial ATP-independent inner membrane protease subunit 1a-like [Salvia miltiorrhiza]
MGMWFILKESVKEALPKAAGVAKGFCFLHVTGRYLCNIDYLTGPSMLPTFNLNRDNIALAETISTRLGKLRSGDIVSVRSPEVPTKIVIKRIKAVAGDVVSYAPDPKLPHHNNTLVVPKGHVWVEGDNPHDSRDSRQFGAVPYALICSRLFLVLWPPSDCRLLSNKIV